MNTPPDFIGVNKELWNKRTDFHFTSEFYDVKSFLEGENSLNYIELNLLGDIKNKSLLHLQCHFGQDSISLARLGAKVTGIDFSENAISKANELVHQTGSDANFICTDIYDLKEKLANKFDIVFTSYGVIGWLPDLKRWAEIISHFLKQGGKFIMAEFHPAVWMFDNDFKFIQYSWFNREVIIEEEEGTYTDRNASIKNKSYSWNHSLSDVLNSLLNAGLRLEVFNEYDYSPYNCFNNSVKTAEGNYRIKNLEEKIPMVYSLGASK